MEPWCDGWCVEGCDDSREDPRSAVEDGHAREPSSFDRFFRDQYPTTVRLAHLLTGSDAVAEELAQDAFAQVCRRFDAIREPRTYLRATTVNTCRNWHRRQNRELDRFRRHGATTTGVSDRGLDGWLR